MHHINLQQNTSALAGTISIYQLDPEAGVNYLQILIPLAPFPYLDGEEDTEVMLDWVDEDLLVGSKTERAHARLLVETEISIYVGGAHNRCSVRSFRLHQEDALRYSVELQLRVHFSEQGVGADEEFSVRSLLTDRREPPG
ncbi:hypothetical protein [Neolewinella antarctica]|uniref:Uncharacterized protein n=1 Tax=Neolewinella antarctica TaxID=442734 RepID=A0ABX0XCR7_9BACT|nr:hypothetical protein [Neolewinella antarctica]NJC27070.1 hypothetical protein [Neolewinella antarctica]